MSCSRSHHHRSVSLWQRGVCGIAVGIASLMAAGCGQGPSAEFSLRDSTSDLIPVAKNAVKKSLTDSFGTPQKLVAWQRFPVNYGGQKGAVGEVTKDGVTVTWETEGVEIHNGAPVIWLTGARAAEKTRNDSVASFNAETKKISFSGSSDPAPATGDTFAVGYGEAIQTGRVVYMKNCMHCHGVSGDGDGPTAKYLNPLPRDYRLGLFKFTSTLTPEKATRDDLHRIVKNGIPGTYMPSFLWLGEKETEAVIEYVRWLAMRGEFEKRLDDELGSDYSSKAIEQAAAKSLAAYQSAKGDDKPAKPKSAGAAKSDAAKEFTEKYEKEDLPTAIDETATLIAQAWLNGETAESLVVPSVPRVADDAASRERGRRLYLSDKGKCYTCHGVQGRGDGVATEDFWKKPGSEEYYPRRGLHDSWGNRLQPRNLTLGQYRGGRRPVDVFRRIYAGIKGTPMPAFGRTALKDDEIWDVVNYVMSLQYQQPAAPSKAAPAGHVAHSK